MFIAHETLGESAYTFKQLQRHVKKYGLDPFKFELQHFTDLFGEKELIYLGNLIADVKKGYDKIEVLEFTKDPFNEDYNQRIRFTAVQSSGGPYSINGVPSDYMALCELVDSLGQLPGPYFKPFNPMTTEEFNFAWNSDQFELVFQTKAKPRFYFVQIFNNQSFVFQLRRNVKIVDIDCSRFKPLKNAAFLIAMVGSQPYMLDIYYHKRTYLDMPWHLRRMAIKRIAEGLGIPFLLKPLREEPGAYSVFFHQDGFLNIRNTLQFFQKPFKKYLFEIVDISYQIKWVDFTLKLEDFSGRYRLPIEKFDHHLYEGAVAEVRCDPYLIGQELNIHRVKLYPVDFHMDLLTKESLFQR